MIKNILLVLSLIVIFGLDNTLYYDFDNNFSSIKKENGAVKGTIQLPKKALRKVIRERRSRGYSKSVLRQAKKAKVYNEYEKAMIYLTPLDDKNLYQRKDITELSQENVSFDPAHIVVQKNSQVNIVNKDNIFHNVFSNSDIKKFNIGKVKKNVDKIISFENTGHIQVFCDIHAFMSSIISIVDTPYYITGDKNGNFKLLNIPSGKYKIEGWHPRAEFKAAIIEIRDGRFTNVKNLRFE